MVSLIAACGGDDSSSAENEADTDGKFDDLDDVDEAACELDDSVDRQLVQFVLNDHVQFRCQGPSGFVATGCCKPALEEFVFATGCPLQAKFETVDDPSAASGQRQHCVADVPNGSEDIGVVELVATSCCTPLCDEAKWDDPVAQTGCRGASGQFKAHACCALTEDACGDAIWDAHPDDLGLTRCWAQSGEFATAYAKASCCMDQCFRNSSGDIEIDDLPIGCLLPVDNECDGATVNEVGACAVELTADERELSGDYVGDFAKAMCCAGQSDLERDLADECYRREIFGDDLSICVQG